MTKDEMTSNIKTLETAILRLDEVVQSFIVIAAKSDIMLVLKSLRRELPKIEENERISLLQE